MTSLTPGSAVLPPSLAMRVYFSTYHLHAATDFASRAEAIEAVHTGRSRFDIEHRTFVTGSIICAIAFLESAINELYADAAASELAYIASLSRQQRARLAKVWTKAEGRDMSILQKYQSALQVIGVPQFAEGRQPFQDTRLAVTLRNELVHYRPQTMSSTTVTRIQQQLRAKFRPSKLMTGAGNPWFPDHCLGAGAAGWATSAARSFSDAFFGRLGAVPNYQRVSF